MMVSPTRAELAAIKTGYAALIASKSPTSYLVEQVVYALGAAQMLMDPETADELRTLRARVAELEKTAAQASADLSDRHDDLAGALGRSIGTEWSDLISIAAAAVHAETQLAAEPRATDGAVAAPGAEHAPAGLTVYRAAYEHGDIPLGTYTTRQAARGHAEDVIRQEYPEHTQLHFRWADEDYEDDPAEALHATVERGDENRTGYVVTPLQVASTYDAEAEE